MTCKYGQCVSHLLISNFSNTVHTREWLDKFWQYVWECEKAVFPGSMQLVRKFHSIFSITIQPLSFICSTCTSITSLINSTAVCMHCLFLALYVYLAEEMTIHSQIPMSSTWRMFGLTDWFFEIQNALTTSTSYNICNLASHTIESTTPHEGSDTVSKLSLFLVFFPYD